MSNTYITMPGTSGNYVDSSDTNMLDSDTAHNVQSDGLWTTVGDMGALSLVADSDAFGESAVRGTVGVAASFITTPTSQAIPVSASTQYSVALRVKVSTAGTYLFRISHLNGASTPLQNSDSTPTLTANTWTTITQTFTTNASAAALYLRFGYNSTDKSGTTVAIDTACLRTGATTTFVPSIRMVGDIDMRAKVAATDWTAAANQTLIHKAASNNGYSLQVTTGGELLGWHGDGTDYNPGTSSGAALSDTVMTELRAAVVEATGVWTYYKNGASFDTDTLGAITATPDTTTSLLVGAATSTTLLFAGDLEWAEIRDGVGGPVVRRFDAADAYAAHGAVINDNDTWTGSVDGATWTAHTDATLTITPGDEPSSGRLLVLGLL